MIFAGERYCYIYRIILTTIGLWPYQKPSVLKRVFFFSAYSSFIIFQLTPFLKTNYDYIVIINMLSMSLSNIIYALFYICLYFNNKKIKHLLEQIVADWNIAEDSEMKILEKYASEGYTYSLIMISVISIEIIVLIITETLPIILDAVTPMNESRPRKIQISFEMFLDHQQYFFVYLIYECVMVTIGFLTMLAMITLILAFMKHSCAIYKIASTLIGNTVTKYTLEIPDDRKACEMYRRITRAVCMHRKAIQFTKYILIILEKWFLVVTAIIVLSLTCNLLNFLIAVTVLKEVSEAIICSGMVMGHFAAMFLCNFMSQTITNHSAEMFTAVCRTKWYLAPLPIQKLLLFVMQHSLKANTLLFGGIYVASLEGFSTLITMSISYFTVLYSIN